MNVRLCAALVMVAAPLAARGADEENPFKKVKVGDFAVYKTTTSFGGKDLEGTVTRTVTAKNDQEATVKTVAKVGAVVDDKAPDEKIDLSKPYDLFKAGLVPAGTEAKVEKLKEGTEKLKAAGKEYDCRWETFRLTAKTGGVEVTGEGKVWQSKDLPLNTVKWEFSADVAGMKWEMKLELAETGHKSD
jgi:hypothetical protein